MKNNNLFWERGAENSKRIAYEAAGCAIPRRIPPPFAAVRARTLLVWNAGLFGEAEWNAHAARVFGCERGPDQRRGSAGRARPPRPPRGRRASARAAVPHRTTVKVRLVFSSTRETVRCSGVLKKSRHLHRPVRRAGAPAVEGRGRVRREPRAQPPQLGHLDARGCTVTLGCPRPQNGLHHSLRPPTIVGAQIGCDVQVSMPCGYAARLRVARRV